MCLSYKGTGGSRSADGAPEITISKRLKSQAIRSPSAPQLERDHAGTHQVIARAAHAHETHTEYWRRRGGRWVRVERSALAGASARQGEHGRARLDGAGVKTRDFLTTIVRSQIPHEVWPTTNME